MKKLLLIAVGLFTGFLSYTTYAASDIPESCKTVANGIASRIINNGVDAKDFKLDIVSKESVTPEMGQIVGNCSSEAFQILYTRGDNINPDASADDYTVATPSEDTDTPAVEEQTTEQQAAEEQNVQQ